MHQIYTTTFNCPPFFFSFRAFVLVGFFLLHLEAIFTSAHFSLTANVSHKKENKTQNELASIYLKEKTEYIQNQIDKIRDSVEDRQSKIARQTNDVSRRKITTKVKLKATNQQERIKLWKQHFENLLGNPPNVTHEPILRIISKQLDIKLGPFTQEELDSEKLKIEKPQGLMKFPQKYGRLDNLMT